MPMKPWRTTAAGQLSRRAGCNSTEPPGVSQRQACQHEKAQGLQAHTAPASAAVDVAEPASRRQIALAAVWALPAFLLLLSLAFFPDIASLKDIESNLGFRSFMESFPCAVAVLIFGVGWYAARTDRSAPMAVLSAAFLAVASLDFAHMLSTEGMPRLFTPAGADKAMAFWLLRATRRRVVCSSSFWSLAQDASATARIALRSLPPWYIPRWSPGPCWAIPTSWPGHFFPAADRRNSESSQYASSLHCTP